MEKKTVYFLIDCSGSMYGNRADAVNTAMEKVVREAIPVIKRQKSSDLAINFMVLGFSDAHQERVFEIMQKTDLDDFNSWARIDQAIFNGGTPTGAAIGAVIADIQGGTRGEPNINAVASAIILISDGLPNGSNPTYEEVLQRAIKGDPNEAPVFRKALRIALGINVDDEGRESLKKFGKVSKKMEQAGIKAYYDCSEDYVTQLEEILKSVTINATIGN